MLEKVQHKDKLPQETCVPKVAVAQTRGHRVTFGRVLAIGSLILIGKNGHNSPEPVGECYTEGGIYFVRRQFSLSANGIL